MTKNFCNKAGACNARGAVLGRTHRGGVRAVTALWRGVANEHLAEALEALVELNDDVQHGRARFCLMAQTIRLHRALSLLVEQYPEG